MRKNRLGRFCPVCFFVAHRLNGKQIVVSVARQLVAEYGDSFEEKNLRRMMQFATEYPDFEIVASLIRQLTWTHFIALFPIREPLKRSFYEQMAITEHWSTRTLRDKIASQLYERTAISRQPEETINHDIALLREENRMTPNMVFRDPYLLHLYGLKDTYSEKGLSSLEHGNRSTTPILKGSNSTLFCDRQTDKYYGTLRGFIIGRYKRKGNKERKTLNL